MSAISPQRLMLRGLLFLAVVAATSAGAGRMSRAVHDLPGAPYTGTASFTSLDDIRQRLDPRRGDTELGVLAEDRANAIAELGAPAAFERLAAAAQIGKIAIEMPL